MHEADSVTCAPWIVRQIENAISTDKSRVVRLPSGAGHDAAAMADLTDVGMIFVRCAGGISHNPDETITEADAGTGADLLLQVIENFRVEGHSCSIGEHMSISDTLCQTRHCTLTYLSKRSRLRRDSSRAATLNATRDGGVVVSPWARLLVTVT